MSRTPLALAAALLLACGGAAVRTVRNEVLHEIWVDDEPLQYANASFVDGEALLLAPDGCGRLTAVHSAGDYPSTMLIPSVVEVILSIARPTFYLEVGSMLGGSAILAANGTRRLGFLNTSVVCIDPFTGDVNMLAWERRAFDDGSWRYLRNERGRPRIYDRFRANVVAAGLADVVIPIQATGIVGMRAIGRLVNEKRLSSLPQVLYLDSAHEADETLLELQVAWSILAPGGILFGDDWEWDAVQTDVLRFAMHHHSMFSRPVMEQLFARLNESYALHGAVIGGKPVVERHGE